MGKRIMMCLLTAALAVSFASCGAQENAPAETTGTQTETLPQSTARMAEGDLALPQQRGETEDAQDSAAGGQDAAETQPEQDAAQEQPVGQYGPLFQKYVRALVDDGAYTIAMRQSGITMVTAVSGEDSALDTDMAGVLRITLINKDGKYYMLMNGTKKYTEMTQEEYRKQADSLQTANVDLSNVKYRESGTETIGGKQYSTETYDEGTRGSVTYFFTGDGLARVRVVKDGKTNDVESFTIRDDADADMFVIPSDYTHVDDASQLMS